jgi:hypothetical protein
MQHDGYSSARAGLIYQDASEEGDIAITQGLSAMVEDALKRSKVQ